MFIPRRAIKLRKSWISKKRFFFDISSAQPSRSIFRHLTPIRPLFGCFFGVFGWFPGHFRIFPKCSGGVRRCSGRVRRRPGRFWTIPGRFPRCPDDFSDMFFYIFRNLMIKTVVLWLKRIHWFRFKTNPIMSSWVWCMRAWTQDRVFPGRGIDPIFTYFHNIFTHVRVFPRCSAGVRRCSGRVRRCPGRFRMFSGRFPRFSDDLSDMFLIFFGM